MCLIGRTLFFGWRQRKEGGGLGPTHTNKAFVGFPFFPAPSLPRALCFVFSIIMSVLLCSHTKRPWASFYLSLKRRFLDRLTFLCYLAPHLCLFLILTATPFLHCQTLSPSIYYIFPKFIQFNSIQRNVHTQQRRSQEQPRVALQPLYRRRARCSPQVVHHLHHWYVIDSPRLCRSQLFITHKE